MPVPVSNSFLVMKMVVPGAVSYLMTQIVPLLGLFLKVLR